MEVKVTYAQNASPYASAEDANWETLAKAVGDTWQGSIVSPYLMMACSDSRHFSAICRDVYKFSAMALSKEQRGLIHNNDERIPVREIAKTVEFHPAGAKHITKQTAARRAEILMIWRK